MKHLSAFVFSSFLLAVSAADAAPANEVRSVVRNVVEASQAMPGATADLVHKKKRRYKRHKARRFYRLNRHHHGTRPRDKGIRLCRWVEVYDHEGRPVNLYRCFLKRRYHRH